MISNKKCPKCNEYLEENYYASDKPEGQNAENVSEGLYVCINPECKYFNQVLENLSELATE